MEATKGIGRIWKPVLNVTDLERGERFWSALSGLAPMGRHGDESGERYSSLEDPHDEDNDQWLLLQLVPRHQESWVGGTHLDLRVNDVPLAVQQAEDIGGVIIKPPAFYPSESPYLEWAVMRDPFGNHFCFVRWPLDGRE